MENENVLTEFEDIKVEKSMSWFEIIFFFFLFVVYLVFGYLYYEMWIKYNNDHDAIKKSISNFSVASFMLAMSINKLIIRYKYIRKSDLTKNKI